MNDLLTIIEVGQPRSRMTRLIIITAARFLASKNQIQLVILEFGDLGEKNWKFQLYTVYANVGQIKVNNNRVICQMSMKLPAMFDQNYPDTFDEIVKKLITTETLSKLDLESKCQGNSINQKIMTCGTKNMPPTKKLSRGSLSYWCDADANADQCKKAFL